jgi:hypothetical protein
MAVITLIGLVTLIIYPQFTISPEKSEIIYIGKLLKSDLDLAREESSSNQNPLSIYFVNNGYGYTINETEITRSFLKYQFTFDLPVPEETKESEDGELMNQPSPNPEPSPGNQDENAEIKPKDGEEDELKPNQLKFSSKGKCNAYELSWQTVHFTGKLRVDPNGILEWSYARK